MHRDLDAITRPRAHVHEKVVEEGDAQEVVEGDRRWVDVGRGLDRATPQRRGLPHLAAFKQCRREQSGTSPRRFYSHLIRTHRRLHRDVLPGGAQTGCSIAQGPSIHSGVPQQRTQRSGRGISRPTNGAPLRCHGGVGVDLRALQRSKPLDPRCAFARQLLPREEVQEQVDAGIVEPASDHEPKAAQRAIHAVGWLRGQPRGCLPRITRRAKVVLDLGSLGHLLQFVCHLVVGQQRRRHQVLHNDAYRQAQVSARGGRPTVCLPDGGGWDRGQDEIPRILVREPDDAVVQHDQVGLEERIQIIGPPPG